MSRYAAETSVPADKTRNEIEKTLQRYGADQFMYGWEEERAVIAFRMEARQVRFVLPMPAKTDRAFTHTPTGIGRSADAIHRAWEQGTRQRWRALLLVVKAKLEAIEAGISGFEDEFLAWLVLPDGSTMGEWAQPQIARAYSEKLMPPSLLALSAGS